MTDTNTLIKKIMTLSRIDGALARIFADKKKLENEKKVKVDAIERDQRALEAKIKTINEKRTRFERDDKLLKGEEENLVQRRKLLSTLGSIKTQQAAQREIEYASKELSAKEEAELASLTELESLGKDEAGLKSKIDAARVELDKLTVEVEETFKNLNERELGLRNERAEAAVGVDPATLTLYNRIKDKYPMDPAVPVINGSCKGCFMQVAPQLLVQVKKAEVVVKCRGCGRLLFIEEDPNASATKS